jgi:hypothetical protein
MEEMTPVRRRGGDRHLRRIQRRRGPVLPEWVWPCGTQGPLDRSGIASVGWNRSFALSQHANRVGFHGPGRSRASIDGRRRDLPWNREEGVNPSLPGNCERRRNPRVKPLGGRLPGRRGE